MKGDAGSDLAIVQGQENTTTWADQSVSFEFAPNGKFSDIVVTEPSSHSGLVLERGNGSANQEFAMTADGSYTNLANRRRHLDQRSGQPAPGDHHSQAADRRAGIPARSSTPDR